MTMHVLNLNISLILYCILFLNELFMDSRLSDPEILSCHLTNKHLGVKNIN
jgi:hypothetical protein